MARSGAHLIIIGFVMAYFGLMGQLLMLSSVNLDEGQLFLVRSILWGMLGLGALILAVGRSLPVGE